METPMPTNPAAGRSRELGRGALLALVLWYGIRAAIVAFLAFILFVTILVTFWIGTGSLSVYAESCAVTWQAANGAGQRWDWCSGYVTEAGTGELIWSVK